MSSLTEYLRQAMRKAVYEPLEGGQGWYAHIPGISGLWATGACVEDARTELYEALDEWLYINGFISQLPPPQLGDVRLEPPRKLEA